SISWCWKATASGRRSPRRLWPCCAPPTPDTASVLPSKRRRSAGPRTRPAAARSRLRYWSAPGPRMVCCWGRYRTTTTRRRQRAASIRPARSRDGFPPRCGSAVDLVIVRENTEGFYADRSMHVGPGEFMPTPDLAIAMRKITRHGSTRIAESAFKLAMQRRKKVTCVHKANVLRVSDGLYPECTRAVAAKYPQVKYEERITDAMAALLVRDAGQFDVVVTTNMYGDILSDEASEIAGSLGLA